MQRIKIYGKLFLYLAPPVALSIIIFFITVTSMPTSAYQPDYRVAAVIKALMPEGWSFFTRSPREEMADLYGVSKTAMRKITICNSDPSNLFGISRRSRKIGMDLSFLANNVPNKYWQNMSRKAIDIPLKDTFLCHRDNRITTVEPGLYVISVFKPTPWAWRNTYPVDQKNYKIALVKYDTCHKN